jgi:hypothetical protein
MLKIEMINKRFEKLLVLEELKWFKAISSNEKEYKSNNQHEFARQYNLNPSSINLCLNGFIKQTNGWKFSYIFVGR